MRNRYVLIADLPAFWPSRCAAPSASGSTGCSSSTGPSSCAYVLAAPLIKAVVFHAFGMYRRFWRYATIDDLIALTMANSAASVAMALFVLGSLFFGSIREFSRTILVADWLLALVATAAVRLSVRVIGESESQRGRVARDRRASACWSSAPGTPARSS